MPVTGKKEKKDTYQDYLSWPEDERWEIVGGQAYDITPAPGTRHQKVVNNMNILLSTHTSLPKTYTVFIAPTDVVLSESDIVQPDVFVVCDRRKITEENIQGAPDLIVEVLSPQTALKDKREKKALYERVGVREYLIIDPIEQFVERFSLDHQGRYGPPELFGPQEVIQISAFEGLEIRLWEVFETEPPEQT